MKCAGTLAISAVLFCVWLDAGEVLTEDQGETYRQLRKDFIIAMAVAASPAGEKMRKEHRSLLRDINQFLGEIGDTAPTYKAAALYFRARLAIKVRKTDVARKDLDAAISVMSAHPAERADLPGGLPSVAAMQIFRAFTFVGEGHDKIMEALEAIPEETQKPASSEVGDLVGRWADALAEHGEDDLALRAYAFIQRFGLWEEEADNPKRKMDLIRYRQNDGMVPQQNE